MVQASSYGALILFWALWIGMIGGATLIIIVNNHDITTTIAPLTTRAMKHAFSSDSQTDILQAVPNSMAFNSMTSDNRIPKQAFMV
ncbi:unnamed protein product [Auanema sp. JU1783]|nr:unnamed protein product [Auanema sp. JU1783]